MKVYRATEFDTDAASEPRAHPYDPSPRATYYDFKKCPELIPEVLRDFKRWATFSAVREFYDLLRWLNGPESVLESNDCAFIGPRKNTKNADWQKRLECNGRLMFFYRDLRMNTDVDKLEFLVSTVTSALEQAEADLDLAAVGVSLFAVQYLALGESKESLGGEVCLTFWAWGDSRREVMHNMDRTVQAIRSALERTSSSVSSLGGGVSGGM